MYVCEFSSSYIVAGKLCDKYGCLRLSIGEAIRRVIAQFPHSELTHQLLTHLHAGETVPEELCVLALDCALLDVQCTTRGYAYKFIHLKELISALYSNMHVRTCTHLIVILSYLMRIIELTCKVCSTSTRNVGQTNHSFLV